MATRQPLEPLWLDVVTTDAVYEIPALSPSSGMCYHKLKQLYLNYTVMLSEGPQHS